MTPADAPEDREQLEAIQQRLDGITPGPWCGENCGEKCTAIVIGTAFAVADEECEHPLSGWPDFSDEDGEDLAIRDEVVCNIDGGGNAGADADFIVHAPEDVAFLLALLRAAPVRDEEVARELAKDWDTYPDRHVLVSFTPERMVQRVNAARERAAARAGEGTT